MGNLITAGSSIFIPLIVRGQILPYLFHPYKWGGIPWEPPGSLTLLITTVLCNIILLQIIATISGVMATLRECDTYDITESYWKSFWPVLGFVIGNIVIYCVPVIKALFLAAFMWLPYADYLVHGALVSIFVLFIGAKGNTKLINELC